MAPVPKKIFCLKLARQKLNQIDRQHLEDSLLCNGRNESNGNKLRTYRTYKTTLSTERYVKSNMRRHHWCILGQFRSCNLPLAIETGRFTKPKTSLNERLCRFSEASAIEDETYLLISCSFCGDLRHELFQNASNVNTNFESMSDSEKLIFLMNTDILQTKIASTLLQLNKRRRSTVIH